MDKIELIGLIARIRRNMPRNTDIMTVCEELERLVISKPTVNVTSQAPVTLPSPSQSQPCPVCAQRRAAQRLATTKWRKAHEIGSR
jgi:hypothetical protein